MFLKVEYLSIQEGTLLEASRSYKNNEILLCKLLFSACLNLNGDRYSCSLDRFKNVNLHSTFYILYIIT